jgi:hypothetical protein
MKKLESIRNGKFLSLEKDEMERIKGGRNAGIKQPTYSSIRTYNDGWRLDTVVSEDASSGGV